MVPRPNPEKKVRMATKKATRAMITYSIGRVKIGDFRIVEEIATKLVMTLWNTMMDQVSNGNT